MNDEERWAAVDDYVTNLLARPDAALNETLAAGASAGLPEISVSAPQGKFLQLLAQIAGARRVLEIGTLAGYSTIWLARALPENGKVITLESDSKHAEVARRSIARAGLANKVEVRVGPGTQLLDELVKENAAPFDFIFIDANKEQYPDYLTAALKLARHGTVIVADNVIRKGEVINAVSNDERVLGVRRFNDLLARDIRLSATAIQTVGNKGYDGFTIALVIDLRED